MPNVAGRVLGPDGHPTSAATVEVYEHQWMFAEDSQKPEVRLVQQGTVCSDGTFSLPGRGRWLLYIAPMDLFAFKGEVQVHSPGLSAVSIPIEYGYDIDFFGLGELVSLNLGDIRLQTAER